ncbi:MAG: BamA/TamA family outer membrane protein [Methylotenera sp.]|nr:BamA/TamA family outer membrane protein [Methylotenera sp.]
MRQHHNQTISTVVLSILLLMNVEVLYAAEEPIATEAEVATQKQDLAAPKDAVQAEANTQVEPAVNYFDIYEFQVEGNTKLTNVQIETAVYPHMGEKKSIDDVNKARDALEKTYHQAGYLTVLVDIPEQDVDKKIVRLNVTEGKVAKFRVKDSKYFSLGRIKALSPSVQEGQVPHFPTLQADITRLNRSSDKRVTPVLRAGKTFGTVEVDLKVEDTLPLHANLELNNRYSRDTTKPRLGGTIKYDNLWQREHSLSLNFLVSPENTDEVQVLSANYLWRFDTSDILLALYGVRSKSNVATVGGVNILGDGTILGARLIKPLPNLDNYFHSISLGIDYKDFGQTIVFGTDFETPVTYAPLSASYSGTWQGATGRTQLNTGVNVGLRGFISDEAEFEARRVGASSNFFVAKIDLQRTQNLPKDFQLLAKIDGQYSGSPLIPNEQFLVGGADTVRGYLESEEAGDQGIHSTLELTSPVLFKNVNWLQNTKLAAFYDIAKFRTIDPLPGQDRQSVLAGYGIGLRAKAWKNFNLNLDLAWALRDSAATEKGDFLSHIRFWYDF